jgi:hypothetical protein
MRKLFTLPVHAFHPKRYRPGDLGTWTGHLPFARDLISAVSPKLIVELGTHVGESYFGFCQAIEEAGIQCRAVAIDTWRGDSHAGLYDDSVFQDVDRYNRQNYSGFSTLIRDTFDNAIHQFADETIDILHIDGLHTYEAVKHDFETWFPKVRPGGIVLLHDTAAKHADFGVWQLWEELQPHHRTFAFTHWWGLGVLQKEGSEQAVPTLLQVLFSDSEAERQHARDQYALAAEFLDFTFGNQAVRAINRVHPALQVFAADPGGYTEQRSAALDLHFDAWEDYSITLPNGSAPGALRIDPANGPCLMELERITLDPPHHEIFPDALSCQGDLIRGHEPGSFMSTGSDPQWILPALDDLASGEPLTIRIRMRVRLDPSPIGIMHASRIGFGPAPVSGTPDSETLKLELRAARAERTILLAEYRQLKTVHDGLTAEAARVRDRLAAEQAARTVAEQDLAREQGQRVLYEADTNRLRQEVTQQIDALEHRRQLTLQAQAAADHLQEQTGALGREVVNLRMNLAAEAQAKALAEAEKADLARHALVLQYAVDEQRKVTAEYAESLSWKITAPLRAVLNLFNRKGPS